MAEPLPRPADILDFWFGDQARSKWFAKDADFDALIRRRFLAAHEAAASGRLSDWEDTPEGALALLILLDQFPRNMFRDTPRAFATDALALDIARRMVAQGFDKALGAAKRSFVYLPFEHSENLANQKLAVGLFESWGGSPEGLDWAQRHLRVIERFGRFPHRNWILGRPDTPEEEAFLKEPGSGF